MNQTNNFLPNFLINAETLIGFARKSFIYNTYNYIIQVRYFVLLLFLL